MTEHLFIRLAASDAQHAAIVVNSEGRIVLPARAASLESIAGLVPQRRVIALVPAADVVTTQADLPNASAARLRQMLPYSLEDAFADDVEQLLFAPGRRLASGGLAVSVVARERVDAWLAELAAAGIRADAVVAETDGVPDTPATLNLMIEGPRIYGRRPGEAAFVFEGLDLAQVLKLIGAEGTDLHTVILADAAGRARYASALSELHNRMASVNVKELPDGILPHLAATLVLAPGTNLLQGPYARKSNWRALARPWYAAAGLAATVAAIAVVGQAVEYFALKHEDGVLTELVTARCGQAFSATRLSACATAVQRRLSEAGAEPASANESFLDTLSAVAESRTDSSVIEALSFRNRVMDLQLVAPDVPALDAFAQQIKGSGRFDVRIQSANPSDAGVEGRLQIVSAGQ